MSNAFERFARVMGSNVDDRQERLNQYRSDLRDTMNATAANSMNLPAAGRQATTEVVTDYQRGAMACFDGCSKILKGCLDDGRMDGAIEMYRRLKGPLGGGLLGYDGSGSVAGLIGNGIGIGYDNGERSLATTGRNAAPTANLPATPTVVRAISQYLHVNRKISGGRENSPEYDRGFMDTFNYLDSNLDKMMDDGSLEAAFAEYTNIRRSQDPLYDLKKFFGAVEVQGSFQDLIDIINSHKGAQNESKVLGKKRSFKEGYGYTATNDFDFDDEDILYWSDEYRKDPENFSISQFGAGEFQDQMDFCSNALDACCDGDECYEDEPIYESSKKQRMKEDFLDDYDVNGNLGAKHTGFRKDLKVSKDLRSRNSKKRAHDNVKGLSPYDKAPEEDLSMLVRKCFTDFVLYQTDFDERREKDGEQQAKCKAYEWYNKTTKEMRSILGVYAGPDEDHFRHKPTMRINRGETTNYNRTLYQNDGKEYRELDGITLAEIVACYCFAAIRGKSWDEWIKTFKTKIESYDGKHHEVSYSPEDDLSNQDKYDICIYAAKAVKSRKLQDGADFAEVSDDILADIKNKLGFDVKEVPDTKTIPFEDVIDPDYDSDFSAALNYTKDEINADSEARKAAISKRTNRAYAKKAADDSKAKAQKAREKAFWDKKFKAAGGGEADVAVADFFNAISYANAGLDYSNVDHDAEFEAAYKIKSQAIKEFGVEEWAKAVKKFKKQNHISYLATNEGDVPDMDKYESPDGDFVHPFDVADSELEAAKEKYPKYFKRESRR